MSGALEKTDANIEEAFAVFDNGANKGNIDIDAFQSALTTMGDKLSSDQVHAFLQECGFDGDAREINVQAFKDALDKYA
jgi:Ca2+-binding EF-hand superfamily protein